MLESNFSISAVDLFCGAGGLTHGLIKAGICVKAGYDIDENCRFPYERNNLGSIFFNKSVTEVAGQELAAHYAPNDFKILVGCAPCQTFSKYTQGRNNKNDPKWDLLNEFSRLIRELKPDIVSMENVPDLQRYPVFQSFLDTLSEENFFFSTESQKRVVYCPDYGIPQHRKRLVVLASKFAPIDLLPPTHSPSTYLTVRNALQKLPKIAAGESHPSDPFHRSSRLSKLNLERIKASKPGGTWRDWPENLIAQCHKNKSGKSYPSVYGRMEWDRPSPTITTQFYGFGNGRFGHPQQNRGLSLREGAILQSFPEDYEFIKPGNNYCFKTIGRMIGNAVPVQLGHIIGKTIKSHIESLNFELHYA